MQHQVNQHQQSHYFLSKLISPAKLLMLSAAILFVCSMCGPISLVAGTPEQLTYKLIKTYPHDPQAFSQGLIVDQGRLIEGTGQYGESQLRHVDLTTGKVLKSLSLNKRYFGEGIAVHGDELFQLTWKEQDVFVYDKNSLKYKRTMKYSGEAWGLTSDGTNLILSDGSAYLRWLDPANLRVTKKLKVKKQNRDMDELNELEYINQEIYANVWHSDNILRISPTTGEVTGILDLSELYPLRRGIRNYENVLNGIAWDADQKKLYVTGKNWPNLFEIELGKK